MVSQKKRPAIRAGYFLGGVTLGGYPWISMITSSPLKLDGWKIHFLFSSCIGLFLGASTVVGSGRPNLGELKNST